MLANQNSSVLVFFDIDGTLLNDKNQIPDSAYDTGNWILMNVFRSALRKTGNSATVSQM